MKRLFTVTGIAYILYTLLLFAVIYYMDSIPDHSDGTSDYSTWREFLYFPVLFIYHGAMSYILMRRYPIYIPFAVTAVLGFAEAVISKPHNPPAFADSMETNVITNGLLNALNYLFFMAIGYFAFRIAHFIIFGIRVLLASKK